MKAESELHDALSAANESEEFAKLRGVGASLLAKLVRSTLPVGEQGEKLATLLLDSGIKGGAEAIAHLRHQLQKFTHAKLKPEQFDLLLKPI